MKLRNMSAADIRATAKGADDDSPYWFAAGIVEGIAPEYCNCVATGAGYGGSKGRRAKQVHYAVIKIGGTFD